MLGGDRTVGSDLGVPAAVLVVAEPTGQRGHAVVGERAGVRAAHQVGEGVDVRHPAGDPELDRPVELGRAGVVEPGEAAVGVPRRAAELEQPVALGLEPARVRRAVEPAGDGHAYVSPTWYVATPSVESLCP